MSFVTQEDVFDTIEPVHGRRVRGIRRRPQGDAARRSRASPIDESMLKYGTDKPDLRNPIEIADVTEHFARLGLRPVREHHRRRRRRPRHPGARGRRASAQLLRQAQRLGARRGRWRARLHHLRRRAARKGPIAKNLDRRARRARSAQPAALEAGRRRVLRRRQGSRGRRSSPAPCAPGSATISA